MYQLQASVTTYVSKACGIVEQMPIGRDVKSSLVRAVYESMHACLSRPAATKARRSYDVVAVSKQKNKAGIRTPDQLSKRLRSV
jgi:hypothetical protein